ncbi:D-methionine transport system permease protein [Natranaerovirga hydrolytica]|uniref:D-methionine transport system permease protein n=1 Tax=Natranaerovirga hydrolytica TaxID=680378 RepID=A0A4R1MKD2_9FIRM|nr:methionine ABC transporter permease [Natranaerovirga hydrolytica]TCK92490.1 D-methionine transport system permease protein [Natranaerovirga hydrolytica]
MVEILDYVLNMLKLLYPPLVETFYMVLFSTVFALIMGSIIGIVLVITEKGHIWEKTYLHKILDTIVNITRSIPFIILIIALFPLSRMIVGTSIGLKAMIVSLSIASAPFVARIIESSLKDVSWGIIESALSVGANNFQIIFKVMIPEAMPSLILGLTITIINILGYSAMAGAIGAGGIGDLAIRYGFHRFQTDVLMATIIVLIIIVEVIQHIGNFFANKVNKTKV